MRRNSNTVPVINKLELVEVSAKMGVRKRGKPHVFCRGAVNEAAINKCSEKKNSDE